jgi:hypothetical protein
MTGEATAGHWEIVYQHLLRIEEHWTAQIQNQQQRNSALVTVNGLLLGFMGFGGVTSVLQNWGYPSAAMFIASIGLLAAALVLGVASMRPRIPPCPHAWLRAPRVVALATSPGPDAVFMQLPRTYPKLLRRSRRIELSYRRGGRS